MAKKFYIKERHNPQFTKPYYVTMGQLSKAAANKRKKSIYGENVMLSYETKEEYEAAINELREKEFSVH